MGIMETGSPHAPPGAVRQVRGRARWRWLLAALVLTAVVAAVAAAVLYGIYSTDPFIGTWLDQDGYVVRLRSDGTGDIGMHNVPPAKRLQFRYTTDQHMLVVVFAAGKDPSIVNWLVSKDGQMMKLDGIVTGIY